MGQSLDHCFDVYLLDVIPSTQGVAWILECDMLVGPPPKEISES